MTSSSHHHLNKSSQKSFLTGRHEALLQPFLVVGAVFDTVAAPFGTQLVGPRRGRGWCPLRRAGAPGPGPPNPGSPGLDAGAVAGGWAATAAADPVGCERIEPGASHGAV